MKLREKSAVSTMIEDMQIRNVGNQGGDFIFLKQK